MRARDVCNNKQINKEKVAIKDVMGRQESITSISCHHENWGLPESEEAFMRSRFIPHFFSESVLMELTCF